MNRRTFTAVIEREDGVTVTCVVSAPADRRDVNELSEFAAMTVVRASAVIDQDNERRARLDEEAPF